MYDVIALGELLVDLAERAKDENGYPTLAANPGGAPGNFLAALSAYGKKTSTSSYHLLILMKLLQNAIRINSLSSFHLSDLFVLVPHPFPNRTIKFRIRDYHR